MKKKSYLHFFLHLHQNLIVMYRIQSENKRIKIFHLLKLSVEQK